MLDNKDAATLSCKGAAVTCTHDQRDSVTATMLLPDSLGDKEAMVPPRRAINHELPHTKAKVRPTSESACVVRKPRRAALGRLFSE